MSYIAERRAEEKDRRRTEIVDAAEAVFAEVGFDAATMDQVARKARLSRALLYVYFKDKSDLHFALCQRAFALLCERFCEAVARNKTGLEQVRAIGLAYVAFSQEFPHLFIALARFEAHSPELGGTPDNVTGCLLEGDRVHDVIVAAIARGVEDGSIRQDVGQPRLVAVALWGFMHGIIQIASTKEHVLVHDGITMRQLVDYALLLASRGMAATS